MNLGILEIFFGKPWSDADRAGWAPFLQKYEFQFYIYGPKADSNLRRNWRSPWPQDYIERLRGMATHFQAHRIQFGVVLSPFGLGNRLNAEDEAELVNKVKILTDVGINSLGIFFDDMMASEEMAKAQIAALQTVQRHCSTKLIFCPSYYSDDPVLEKVFGPRPPNYFKEISANLSSDVEIVWTGPQVISEEILADHLVRIQDTLRRKPFICDNLFATDGPLNCKFLKTMPLRGRDKLGLSQSSYWSFNPMNQVHLSKVVILSAALCLRGELNPRQAFEKAIGLLCSEHLGRFIIENQKAFSEAGLDSLSLAQRDVLKQKLAEIEDPMATEINSWLNEDYVVGEESLNG